MALDIFGRSPQPLLYKSDFGYCNRSRTVANKIMTVFTTPNLSRQHAFGLIDRAPCLAQAPGWPSDGYAKESCCRPRREDREPATKQHTGGRCGRQLQHHAE
jgi:hypothetical protein